jgi:YqaJ-like viral recombinase domain
MKIIDCKQGTSQWAFARAGVVTASEFDNIVTPSFAPRDGKTVETYLYTKLAERCMGCPLEQYGGSVMQQGTLLEVEALPFFEFTYGVKLQKVGFITTDDGRLGCSPDALTEDGGLEAKCPQPPAAAKYLLEGVLPPQYAAQVHGSMLVTGRSHWKFLSYSRQFPAFVLRVDRDEGIQTKLRAALDAFLARFDVAYAKIKALKDAEDAAHTAP